MYELVRNVAQTGDDLIAFCDSQYENGSLIPDIGNASDESPFRIGLTSYSLLEVYINVQHDPRCVTILHLDSTHNMVRQRYNVFILGISDSCGQFFPLVYYCASQRRAEECISYLKRVMMQTFAVRFSPQFVMTDADNAQYNACTGELPTTKVLMCWFHVCQNVWKKSRKLKKLERDIVFRDLNDLHFCRSQEEFETKVATVKTNWRAADRVSARFHTSTKKLIRQWLDNSHFSKWQAFHTPAGYPTTNNPVEQYHRTVKLVNSTSRATPIEMVQLLNQSRIGFLSKKTPFTSITKVSKRLKAHYNRIKKRGELTATLLQQVGDLQHQFVQVSHEIRLLPAEIATHQISHTAEILPSNHRELILLQRNAALQTTDINSRTVNLGTSRRTSKQKQKKRSELHADDVDEPIKSSHTVRMQFEDMPAGGWIVDATTRACQCRFHGKYNMCPHIIEATKVSGLPCPGLPNPVRRFMTRDKRSRNENVRRHISINNPSGQSYNDNSTDIERRGYEDLIHQSLALFHGVSTDRSATTASEMTEPPTQIAGAASDLGDQLVPLQVRCPPVPVFTETLTRTPYNSAEHAMITDTFRRENAIAIGASHQHTRVDDIPGGLLRGASTTTRAIPSLPRSPVYTNCESCMDTKRRRC